MPEIGPTFSRQFALKSQFVSARWLALATAMVMLLRLAGEGVEYGLRN
jgi:hypothetical protein